MLRRKYVDKCEEVRQLKKGSTEDALAHLKDLVPPRFFKLLKMEVKNYKAHPNSRSWDPDELAEHETLRQRGPRAYAAFPVTKPSRQTTRRRWAKLHLKPGLNPKITELMRRKVAAMPPKERICFVCFDEMSLRACLSLMENWDLIAGFVDFGDGDRRPELAKEVLVGMVRSVYGQWKMPFAFWFTDKTATANDFALIFYKSMDMLIDVEFDLRALVTDALLKNLAAEHILGASHERPFFFIRGKKIYTIADVPHLIKSLRNALFSYFLSLQDGTLVDAKYIKLFAVYDMDMGARLAPKITYGHLVLNNFNKMNVALATQVLSKSVGAGVQTYASLGVLPPEAMATGKFCEEMNDLFDSLNGKELKEDPEPGDFKCAVTETSSHLELWATTLRDMESWEFLGGDRVQVLRNFRMDLRAFTMLWQDLRAEGHTHFPVGAVNQDCEENLFSRLRWFMGHTGNLSAEEFTSSFLRAFVVNITAASKGKNCRDDGAMFLVSMEELMELLQEADDALAEAEVQQQEEEVDDVEEMEVGLEAVEAHELVDGIEVLEFETGEEALEALEAMDAMDAVDALELLEAEDGGAGTLEDLTRPVPQDVQKILIGNACCKFAAPLVTALVKKLKCDTCKGILQSEPQYPIHIHHTITAKPSNFGALQPSVAVASLVQQVKIDGIKQLAPILHLPEIMKRGLETMLKLPAVKKFRLCPNHNGETKQSFFKSILKKALIEELTRRNILFKERLKKVSLEHDQSAAAEVQGRPRKSKKHQRVSHL